MTADALHNLEAPERSLDRIDRLIGEALRLARSDSSPEEFFAGLAERLLSASSALAAAVWLRSPDGVLQRLCQSGSLPGPEAADGSTARRRLVERALNTSAPAVVDPQTAAEANDGAVNDTGCLLLVFPFSAAGVPRGAVELVQRSDLPAPVREGCMQLLEEFCDIARDYSTAEELRAMRRRAELWAQFERFAQRIHSSLSLRDTAFSVVNEARPLIGCDRVGLVVRQGSGCRTWAVSGVDAVNRRSAAVRALETLSTAVLSTGEALWYDETSGELAPQIDGPLHAYLETSPARALAVVPLFAVEEGTDLEAAGAEGGRRSGADLSVYPVPFAALIVERFDAAWDGDMPRRATAVAAQCTTAVQNALEHRSTSRLPVLGRLFGKPWRRPPSRARWWTGAAAVLLAAVAALSLVPADFDVAARGQLLPRDRRNVHAPADGIVRIADLPVAKRDGVQNGEIVAAIRSPELDREYARVFGELQTVRKQLDGIRTARLRDRGATRRRDERDGDLGARERELLQRRDNLQRDLQLLKARSEELQVRSPLAGRVLTWDVVRRLDGRPVRRGDVLMRVARLDGPWELELDLPESDAGYVRAARNQSRPELAVSFQLSNDPGVIHLGKIKSVAAAADFSQQGPSFVRVVVAIDDPSTIPLRPGTTVTARIHCGRRAVGYVWFHDLIDAVRSRL